MMNIETRMASLVAIGQALADPTRCRILVHLLEHPCYPAELAEERRLGRPNVSNHLKLLREQGLVATTLEGRRTRYDLADDHLRHALDDLLNVVAGMGRQGGS